MKFFDIAEKLPGIRVMLYGASSSGKTSIATAITNHPEFFPALVVDVDRGLRSIAHRDNGEKLRGVTLSNVLELNAILEQLILPEDKRVPEMAGIKTVVIDSISAFRDDTMAEIRANEARKNKRPSEYITQIQDYNQALAIVDGLVSQLRNTGVNLIVTAEERIEKDPLGIITSVAPELNPRLSRAMLHKFDFIWPVERKDGKVGVRVISPPGVPCNHIVKLRASERMESAIMADPNVNAKGFFLVPDRDFEVIPYIYNIQQENE